MPEEVEPMIPTHLLLTSTQRDRLARLARREEHSLSDVARRALDFGLNALEGRTREAYRENPQTLEELKRVREEMRTRSGVYRGDLVAESRRARQQRGE